MAEKKKVSLKNYLDALIDDDGLKTEVTITLTDRTLTKAGIYLVGTVVLGTIAFFTIRGIVQNIEYISTHKNA